MNSIALHQKPDILFLIVFPSNSDRSVHDKGCHTLSTPSEQNVKMTDVKHMV